MGHQVVALNSPAVQSIDTAQASSLCERDGNADLHSKHFISDNAASSLGGLFSGYATKSADTTLDETYYTVFADATAGLRTITLPPAATSTRQIVVIKKSDSTANAVAVKGNVAELVDGANIRYLVLQNESVTVQCDGTGWKVLDWYIPTLAIKSAAALYTVDGTSLNHFLTAGAGGFTVTLPDAAKWVGKTLNFKRMDAGAGTLTLSGAGGNTIDTGATLNLSATQYFVTSIFSDGTNWQTISNRN